MMPDDSSLLPKRPFFSCETTGLSIVDIDEMQTGFREGGVTPRLTLRVGPRNILEQRPIRVVQQKDQLVAIQCDGDVIVYLDFDAGTARKRTSDGGFLYCGAIDEGNDGKGYIPAA